MQEDKRTFLNRITDILTLVVIYFIYIISRILPISILSTFFGIISVIFCCFIPETYLANRNLKLAMPEKNCFDRIKIILGMWFNMGLFLGEYCYVYGLSEKKLREKINFKVGEKELVDNLVKNIKNKKGTLIVSGHFSNWELILSYLAKTLRTTVNVVYRQSNNTLLENTIIKNLKKKLDINLVAKQDNAGFKIVRALKQGELVIMLVDQRDKKNGELIEFFGQPAYTNKTAYTLYNKLDIDLYYFYFSRNINFLKLDLYFEKLNLDKNNIDEKEFLTFLNTKLEESIRKKPSQWFWIHNRWKIKNKFKKN